MLSSQAFRNGGVAVSKGESALVAVTVTLCMALCPFPRRLALSLEGFAHWGCGNWGNIDSICVFANNINRTLLVSLNVFD